MRRRLVRRAVVLQTGDEAKVLGERRAWTVLIRGVSAGGPERLRADTLATLLEIERRGLHTVLLAAERADLHTEVAAVTRYVMTDDVTVAREAREIWGADNVLEISSADSGQAATLLNRLPVPPARTWQRGLVRRLRWLRRAR